MRFEQQLEGQHGVLLGIRSPIGQAIRDTFTQHGATLLCLDSRLPQADLNRLIKADGRPFSRLVTVFQDEAYGLVPDLAEQAFTTCLAWNLEAVHTCVQAVLPFMKAQEAGSMVHLLPAYASWTVPGCGATAAAAAGVTALSRAVAMEFGKFFIRSNCLLAGPGFFPTPEGEPVRNGQLPADPVDAAELADAALFLCGSLSGHITGEWLPVDGGAGVIAHQQLYQRGGWFA